MMNLSSSGSTGSGYLPVKQARQKLFAVFAGGANHSFEIEIAETVDPEIFADFRHRFLVRDQFFRIGKIDPVMAGKAMRRTTHPHVHFLRAGFAQVDDAGARGRSPNDRIVDHHDAFSFHRFLDQVEFHPHIEVANELARLKKGAPDVVIADEGVLVGNVELVRESERGIVARVGHRHDEVGFDRKFSRQLAAHLGPHFGDVDAADDAVGPREIDVFEHAKGRLLFLEGPFRAKAVLADDEDFARLDFADEFRVNEIEGASLGGEDVGAVEFA